MTAIFLAAGVTIGAVVGAITNALKSMGNQLANSLKTVGAKAASALPGLIGAIVSFLFKTAGQAIGYLAEHTWGPFLERPGKLSGPVSHPLSSRKLYGCFSKLPLFSIPLIFSVTCPVSYGRS